MSRLVHPRVVLDAPIKKVPTFLTRATNIHDAMAANASVFTAPVPPLPTLLNLIQVAETAQHATATGTKGLAATRNLRVAEVAQALDTERTYVQTVVNASVDEAAHIAGLASMRILVARPRTKAELTLSLAEPGSIKAAAFASLLKKGRRPNAATTYNWRFTPDGGKTFVSAPSTPLAHTVFTGLTPMTTYGFEVCITDGAGTTPWSQTASILVR